MGTFMKRSDNYAYLRHASPESGRRRFRHVICKWTEQPATENRCCSYQPPRRYLAAPDERLSSPHEFRVTRALTSQSRANRTLLIRVLRVRLKGADVDLLQMAAVPDRSTRRLNVPIRGVLLVASRAIARRAMPLLIP